MKRPSGRAADQLRSIRITRNTQTRRGIRTGQFGDTKVICTVSVENGVPRFLKARPGLVDCRVRHAAARHRRAYQREASRGKQGGRTLEIQRLIGRSLRAALDMSKLATSPCTSTAT